MRYHVIQDIVEKLNTSLRIKTLVNITLFTKITPKSVLVDETKNQFFFPISSFSFNTLTTGK